MFTDAEAVSMRRQYFYIEDKKDTETWPSEFI
jgi:hypothetical protein